MYEFVKLLFDICLFRKGPQDLPVSVILLRLTMAIYAAVSALILLLDRSVFEVLLQVAVEILLVVVFAKGVLALAGKSERYVQTACALFGTDALIGFFAVPVFASLAIERMTLLAVPLYMVLVLWNWTVTGHILKHALSESYFFALGIALLYIVGTVWLMSLLFPGNAAP
ncbi:MAG: hypothetical protein ACU84J_11105 [Gammaproteobacteria bacterium]